MLCQLKALANPASVRFNGLLQPIGSSFKDILNKANCLNLFSSVLSQRVCILWRDKKVNNRLENHLPETFYGYYFSRFKNITLPRSCTKA